LTPSATSRFRRVISWFCEFCCRTDTWAILASRSSSLQKEIDALLKQAQATDEADDVEHGIDLRGDELPEALNRRETRLQKIREAKAALEEQARQKAADHAAQLEAEGRTPRNDPNEAVPKPKDQRNFTDLESTGRLATAFDRALRVTTASLWEGKTTC
jgi:hypothetical protein